MDLNTRHRLEDAAVAHARGCARCAFALTTYARELTSVLDGQVLPDELASKIRAQVCRDGARIVDEIMGAA